MEVALISPTTIRLKNKATALVIDPVVSKAKIEADAVMLLKDSTSQVEIVSSRLCIAGPGEYEIGGIKITGVRSVESVSYYLSLDGVSIVVAPASSLKSKESLRDVDVAILLADALVDESVLATVTNGVAVFYGPMAQENGKALGKELQSMSKYAITKDKLPAEMEVVLLA